MTKSGGEILTVCMSREPVTLAQFFFFPLFMQNSLRCHYTKRFSTHFSKKLARLGIEWRTEKSIWRSAGQSYYQYVEGRRKQKGDKGPRRILADFLIGAHGNLFAKRFLTFDEGIYRQAFPNLAVIILPSSRH
ncbi:MAG: hypothetical protein ACRCYY_17705 [Trueperaceae bacterium]